MITQKLQDDLLVSLKAKNAPRVATLRLLISEMKNAQIDSGAELTDEQAVAVLKKFAKKLQEAADMFEKGGRSDLAAENTEQLSIVQEYLPAEMSDEDLEAAIREIVAENADVFAANRNAVTGIAMKKLSSQASPQRIMGALQKIA